MIHTKIVRVVAGVLLLQTAMAKLGESLLRSNRRMSGPGDRVSQLDISSANCMATTGNDSQGFALTSITYYYAIESSSPVKRVDIVKLEKELDDLISSKILWCTQTLSPAVNFGDRMLSDVVEDPRSLEFSESRRSLTIKEARRLDILSFSTAPRDKVVVDLPDGENPCSNSSANYCVVVEGRMSLVADDNDNLIIAVASILDATQKTMDDDSLATAIGGDISKVMWLGETLDEVRDGVGTGIGGGVVDVDSDSEDPVQIVDSDESTGVNSDDDGLPLVYIAAIPMVVLLVFGLLLAKNKRKRDVRIPADLLSLDEDHVIVGTGDPPRCFHEGMYHYTRSGARYLSTNCAGCIETRRIGFFTDADLPTIKEGRLYDPASPSDQSFSFEDVSVDGSELNMKDSKDSSHRRRKTLVKPSTNNLGTKHSAIDVHQCTSATCRICAYRAGDVAFVSSPAASPASKQFVSNGSCLDESCVV